jgi:biotin carboxyl carrier protein
MTEANGHKGQHAAPATARRRTPWPLALVAALFVIVPFFVWYGTWFGRNLSDAEIERYLKDEDDPRHEQHALSQIVERMGKGDANVRRWYPQIVQMAASRHADVRMTAAWAMGRDTNAAEFHTALLNLLQDGEPIVRRNAALALVAFNDARAHTELGAMLRPYTFNAPMGGQLISILPVGTPIKREGMLARVRDEKELLAEVRSPLPGRIAQVLVAQGADIKSGQPLVIIAPDEDTVSNALVGLRYVGTSEDLSEVERLARGEGGVSDEIKREAALTTEAIKRRMEQSGASK